MIYDTHLLDRFTARRQPDKDTIWSLWENIAPGISIFTRVQNGSKIWAWGENPYTCPTANTCATLAEVKELIFG